MNLVQHATLIWQRKLRYDDVPIAMSVQDRYEERFGPVRRVVERVGRAIAWKRGGRKILVELRWRLGDEIMALPIYGALAAAYPGAEIGVWCHYPELLEGHPHARPVSPETFTPDRYIFLRDASRTVFRLQHYADLAGVPLPGDVPRLYFRNWIPATPLPEKPYLVLAPGASWAPKRWPVERWRAVAQQLERDGRRVVVLGNAGEGIGAGMDLTGRTSVRDAACLLRHADLALTADSGLMHLALAVETPTVALFGPTDPAIVLRPTPRFVSVTNQRPCYACWNRSLAMTSPGVCPESIPECLDTISEYEVLRAIRAQFEPR